VAYGLAAQKATCLLTKICTIVTNRNRACQGPVPDKSIYLHRKLREQISVVDAITHQGQI